MGYNRSVMIVVCVISYLYVMPKPWVHCSTIDFRTGCKVNGSTVAATVIAKIFYSLGFYLGVEKRNTQTVLKTQF